MQKTFLAGMLMFGLVACAPAPAPPAAAAAVPDQPAPVVNATPCVLRDNSDCSQGDLRRLRNDREQQSRDQRARDQRLRDERARRLPPRY